ncbi:hypothetical protein [Burkholderia sp. PU8-34]
MGKRSKSKKRIGAGAMMLTLLSACVPFSVDQMPVREQRNFLRDIKRVVDAGDLADVATTSKWLGVDFIVEDEQDVFSENKGASLGDTVRLKAVAAAKEYDGKESFRYSMYFLRGSDIRRIFVSARVNRKVICVSSSDVGGIFKGARRGPYGHGYGWEYSYQGRGEKAVLLYFQFLNDGCLYKFGFRQGDF